MSSVNAVTPVSFRIAIIYVGPKRNPMTRCTNYTDTGHLRGGGAHYPIPGGTCTTCLSSASICTRVVQLRARRQVEESVVDIASAGTRRTGSIVLDIPVHGVGSACRHKAGSDALNGVHCYQARANAAAAGATPTAKDETRTCSRGQRHRSPAVVRGRAGRAANDASGRTGNRAGSSSSATFAHCESVGDQIERSGNGLAGVHRHGTG